jgi:tetratricopeptide (TPR) repeat protein
MLTDSIPAANEAVSLAPSDPEGHRALAAVFNHLRLFDGAKNELETATSLRPNDDYLWLELGNVKDELGDTKGALDAFNEAVRFAPYYAHTHWQRGNLLLRMGRYPEAFADLRQAAHSNRDFLPNLIDLAWGLSRSDIKATEQLVQINDNRARITLARFLARQGRAREAVDQFNLAAASASEENKLDLQRQLIDAKAFKEAFELWRGPTDAGNERTTIVYDGGFEGPLSFDEVVFGWRVPREQEGVSISLDGTQPHSGAKSLRIQFNGISNPGASLISQTVVVKPQQRYRISFAVRTKDVVTGGLPSIYIRDAVSGQLLGNSIGFPQATTSWQVLSFEFTTLEKTDAVILTLQRKSCNSNPCPVFGFVWLDSFSVVELD